jgi:acyl-coenzyme A synthetase/AMP-(fatty) acid ligase
MVALSQLLGAERPDDAVVAWRAAPGGDRVLRWSDFRAGVLGLERSLRELPAGRVALYTADAYAFAIGLLAIWQSGRVAVCPPNGQPDSLEALCDVVIAAVSDDSTPVPGRPLLAPEGEADDAGEPGPLVRSAPALELFTSGTTGRGKAVAKALHHLEDEVALLDSQLGERVGDAPVFGSASHQHLYGMLFRVLWPLAAGRPFHATALLHAEELAARLRDHATCALVSVPAQLKRLAERDGFAALARRCRVVFSSGGPLAAETAERWQVAAGHAPVEIFGSTETGGVAWRRQGRGRADAPWTPFEGVRVSRDPVDGRLRVHSQLASVGDQRTGFAMGDAIRLEGDGRFAIEGRTDRVLKIGEKRLSLPEMEERLRVHPLVDEVALLPLEQAGETRLAAVIVPTAEAREQLHRRGRRAVSSELREALAREWDRVLLPRYFRFVRALPEDAQGKVTLALLRACFDEPSARTAPESPA